MFSISFIRKVKEGMVGTVKVVGVIPINPSLQLTEYVKFRYENM